MVCHISGDFTVVQQLVHDNNDVNIKVVQYWPLVSPLYSPYRTQLKQISSISRIPFSRVRRARWSLMLMGSDVVMLEHTVGCRIVYWSHILTLVLFNWRTRKELEWCRNIYSCVSTEIDTICCMSSFKMGYTFPINIYGVTYSRISKANTFIWYVASL